MSYQEARRELTVLRGRRIPPNGKPLPKYRVWLHMTLSRRKHARCSPEYHAWASMKQRCYNQHYLHYKNYGGRGIHVCKAWRHSFEQFLADVGPRPGPGYSLDRIDVNGHYEPGNVRWATWVEQANNRRPRKDRT